MEFEQFKFVYINTEYLKKLQEDVSCCGGAVWNRWFGYTLWGYKYRAKANTYAEGILLLQKIHEGYWTKAKTIYNKQIDTKEIQPFYCDYRKLEIIAQTYNQQSTGDNSSPTTADS